MPSCSKAHDRRQASALALGGSPATLAGAIHELKAQFATAVMKVLLRSQIEQDLACLEQRVQALSRQLADFMQIEVLDQTGTVHVSSAGC